MSGFHADAPTVDCAGGYPAIDVTPIVADLKTRALNSSDQVKVLSPFYLAENDLTDL
jgi:hypothetical protein